MKIKLFFILCFFVCIDNMHASDASKYVDFARTYGIVRYFSPNPYTKDWSESDWMKVCALLAYRAETQPLETVFESLAPGISFSSSSDMPEGNVSSPSEDAMYYRYTGSGKLDVPLFAKLVIPGLADYIPYYSSLSAVADAPDDDTVPVAGQYYSYPVACGKYLHIRHALSEDMFSTKETKRLLEDAKKYWKSHMYDNNGSSRRRNFIFGLLSDKAVRVADITVRWNIIRHFYPYYEDDSLDWDRQLEKFMGEVVQMEDIGTAAELAGWYNMLCRFLNPVQDGHLFLRRDMEVSPVYTTYLPEYSADAECRIVNDTLLIRTGSDGRGQWRILHAINGSQVSELMQNFRGLTNAATEAHRDRMVAYKFLSASEYGTRFIVRSSDLYGTMYEDTLYAHHPDTPATGNKRQPVRKYRNGILYVNAMSQDLDEKLFLSSLTPDVKGLCIDLRGLPSYRFEDILAHLIPTDSDAPATEVPVACFPFRQHISWQTGSEVLKAKSPHVSLPAVFLCDAGTVSWGETIMMMVRQYRLGEIIGQTSAGTTGDMTWFNLPIFPFSMTGMRMRCMDGSKHHALGIVPDLAVPIYVKDNISEFDRTLHAAFDFIESQIIN